MAGTTPKPPLIQEITLTNLLSYGPDTPPLKLHSLNVLIGPNGSGKSNLIEAISLFRGAARDLRALIREGGGIREWVWKGGEESTALVEAVITQPDRDFPLMHTLGFREHAGGFNIETEIIDEYIYGTPAFTRDGGPAPIYIFRQGQPAAFRNKSPAIEDLRRGVGHSVQASLRFDQSIVSRIKEPLIHDEISYLSSMYERISIFRDWEFGRTSVFRVPQSADMRNDRLEDDSSNLGLILNRLRRTPAAKARIHTALADLYKGITDFDVIVQGNSVQVFFTEGDFTIPATRLSDGSLRYLCLLAILCDPEPPPLICIEEPELGMHPDIIPKIADLLREASERTQLIVTTHSDILIDALTEHPETVIVCEKVNGCTTLRRLNRDDLAHWLEKYRLGELWTRGEIGGVRW